MGREPGAAADEGGDAGDAGDRDQPGGDPLGGAERVAARRRDEDVRRLLRQARQDRALEPGQERDRDDERRDAQGEARERGAGDDADLGVAAGGPEVPPRQEEGDQRGSPFGRMSGKRITSRIEGEPVKSIASRSIPTPSPAVGGMPYERAST